MLKTYIGPQKGGVIVVVLGQLFGIVKPGESIVVPDELAEKVGWAKTIWADGLVPKAEDEEKRSEGSEPKATESEIGND